MPSLLNLKNLGFLFLAANTANAKSLVKNLGPVSAEERVFEVNVEDCKQSFTEKLLESSCSYSDKSLTLNTSSVLIETSPGYDREFYLDQRSSVKIRLETYADGWKIFLSEKMDGTPKAISFSDSSPYIQSLIQSLNGKVQALVFVTKKP